MASIVLQSSAFPPGTVLGAYRVAGQPELPLGKPVIGSPEASATVQSDGTAAFTGLAEEIPYFAVAPSGAYLRFSIPASASSGSLGDVVGPDLATDSHLAQFNGTTGKLLKDGGLSSASFDAAGTAASAAAAAQAASQPLDADLTAIAALTTLAFGRSLLTAADAAAGRTLLGLVIGTDVQAYNANLAAIAGLTTAADKLTYWTGSGAAATTTLSSFIRTLLDDADAATARATLGVGSGTGDVVGPGSSTTNHIPQFSDSSGKILKDGLDPASFQAVDADLTAIAALTSAANKLPYATGSGTWALTDLTAFARTLLDDVDAAAARATLGAGGNTVVFRTSHTFAVQGAIAVPSGDTDFIPPFFVSLGAGETVKVAKARYRINGGTSATLKLQKNGSDITGFTGMSATTTAASTAPTAVSVAEDDAIAVVVTAVTGSPVNLSCTVVLEHTVAI